MSTTLIKTNALAREKLPGAGEVTEIINEKLCGAKNVTAKLRWLRDGEEFDAEPLPGTHQLLYFMEGAGTITLDGERHPVSTGAGIYLGPSESAVLEHSGKTPAKLLHLIVPELQD
jgi:mannose-6-phosphate isomerase-like protein (cupin superfamily)